MTQDSRVAASLTQALEPMQGTALHAAARRTVLNVYARSGAQAALAKAEEIVGNFVDVTLTKEFRRSRNSW